MALLNPYLNPFAQTNDEIDDILFISDRERIVIENEKKDHLMDENGMRGVSMKTNWEKLKELTAEEMAKWLYEFIDLNEVHPTEEWILEYLKKKTDNTVWD